MQRACWRFTESGTVADGDGEGCVYKKPVVVAEDGRLQTTRRYPVSQPSPGVRPEWQDAVGRVMVSRPELTPDPPPPSFFSTHLQPGRLRGRAQSATLKIVGDIGKRAPPSGTRQMQPHLFG